MKPVLFGAIGLAVLQTISPAAADDPAPKTRYERARDAQEELDVLSLEEKAADLRQKVDATRRGKQTEAPIDFAPLAPPSKDAVSDTAPFAPAKGRNEPVVFSVRGLGDDLTAIIAMPDGVMYPVQKGSTLPKGLRVQEIDRFGVVVARKGSEPYRIGFNSPLQASSAPAFANTTVFSPPRPLSTPPVRAPAAAAASTSPTPNAAAALPLPNVSPPTAPAVGKPTSLLPSTGN